MLWQRGMLLDVVISTESTLRPSPPCPDSVLCCGSGARCWTWSSLLLAPRHRVQTLSDAVEAGHAAGRGHLYTSQQSSPLATATAGRAAGVLEDVVVSSNCCRLQLAAIPHQRHRSSPWVSLSARGSKGFLPWSRGQGLSEAAASQPLYVKHHGTALPSPFPLRRSPKPAAPRAGRAANPAGPG